MSKGMLAGADHSGLPQTGLAVVGFSGGADSMALAHWLLGKIGGERILLAHVNHMLRGAEAERDEAAVRRFARETGLRLAVSRVNVGALAAQKGLGLEECGREVRYRFFDSLAPGENDRILTAHHAGDNAETLLLNLCRGAGLDGLCGIPPRRGKVLRPFLRVGREEIEEYCAENRLPYVTDSTNLSGEFARNRLRLEVLPILKELNPRVLEAMAQTVELLSRDRDFIRQEGEKLLAGAAREYGLDARALEEAHPALRGEALRLWLGSLGCKGLEKKHLDLAEACLERGGAAQLPGGVTLRRHQGLLSACGKEDGGPFVLSLELPLELPEGGKEIPLPGKKVLILKKIQGPFPKTEQKIHNLDFKNALGYDIMSGILIIRSRREGDRFSPAGRKCSKPLKQIFQECGMPAELRGGAVLLECGGRIAWCEGAGVSEEFRVTGQTRTALSVSVRRLPGE